MIYVLIVLFIYILICFIMFIFICYSNKVKAFKIIDRSIEDLLLPYKNIYYEALKWIKTHKYNNVSIKAYDGVKLTGIYFNNPKEKANLILAHGYRSKKERDLYASVHEYYNMGFSILLVDMRGCASGGKYITFGYKESKDLSKWVDYIYKKNPKSPIVLGGISLGATATLLTNNPHVKCMIEDSAFVSAYDEIKYCIKYYFHLPSIIFMPLISLFCKFLAGFSLKKTNTLDNLANLNIPILFIHGSKDDFVPVINCNINYDNYKGKKEILIIDGAMHGMGYLIDRDKYISTIKKFTNKYVFK